MKRIKSLEKAFGVLDCFRETQTDWGVSELAKELNLPKSTVASLLKTMVDCGYLRQDDRTKKYHLGLRVFELGFVARIDMQFRKYALPILEELQRATEEIVYLTVPRYGEVLYLETVHPCQRQVRHSDVGRLGPMHCTGVGKAMMAYMPDEYVEQIVAVKGLQKFTSTTITTLEELKEELARTRERGYAIDNGEHDRNIGCVAIPLVDDNGLAVAGVSVSGPVLRFGEDVQQKYAELTMEAVTSLKRYIHLLPESCPIPSGEPSNIGIHR
jgi:IclR family KDG regulon transcriptional repressor